MKLEAREDWGEPRGTGARSTVSLDLVKRWEWLSQVLKGGDAPHAW